MSQAAPSFAQDQQSTVLAANYKLPKGFTSIQASEQPETKWRQIDALYTDPAGGGTIRFTVVRAAKEMAEPGRHPIDVCVRDAQTGEILVPPQVFGSKPLIEGCARDVKVSEEAKKRSEQIIDALDALTAVRFKPDYHAEYIALVNQSMKIVTDAKETQFGGGVIIHRKNPELPPLPATSSPPAAK